MKAFLRFVSGLCMLAAAFLSYSGEMAAATFYVAMAIYFRQLAQEIKP